jgi:NADH dehydrogenase [ubiquinone] 1 alpha subcomplex assembly factor 7
MANGAPRMTTPLTELVIQRIREQGPMNVAQLMEIALADPEHGYYMQRDPLGARGDFITAPEISQVFGEIIGAWLAAQWKKLGSPTAALVELGPGRGTLMADMLRATKHIKGFHESVSIHLVETSPTLKQKQWATLAGKHPRVEWHESVDTLPAEPLLLVANEFFDALPIRQFVGQEERMVALDADGALHFTPAGEVTAESCESAITIMKQLAQHLIAHPGVALIIDYGYAGGSSADTLQAMKEHGYHPVLEALGEADITAHVDLDALKNTAQAGGLTAHGPTPQGAFLMRLGAGVRTTNLCAKANADQQQHLMSGLRRLADPAEMGELFKVLCIAPAGLTPEGF